MRNVDLRSWKAKTCSSIFKCSNLESLSIYGYKGPDLHPFSDLVNLTHLTLGPTTVESLEGIEKLVSLRRLEIFYASRFKSFGAITGAERLQGIEIEMAKSLSSLDELAGHPSLQALSLTECVVDSVRPLSTCPNFAVLRVKYRPTKVRDGDFTSLLSLPHLVHVDVFDQPHYTHKNDQMPKDPKWGNYLYFKPAGLQ